MLMTSILNAIFIRGFNAKKCPGVLSGEEVVESNNLLGLKQSFSTQPFEARASVFPGGNVILQFSDVSTIFPCLSTSRGHILLWLLLVSHLALSYSLRKSECKTM